MSLHLIFSTKGLDAAVPRARSGDAIVLLGDGVYAAGGEHLPDIERYILAEDAAVRGVTTSEQTIDYADLAELCATHSPIVSWNDA